MIMFHTATELLPPPSSPTISSISSSDFDTESSGSFFHDRSTTLGTLMGVTTTFLTITFRTPSQRRDLGSTPNHRNYVKRTRRKKEKTSDLVAEQLRKRIRRRNWRWLCGDGDQVSNPSNLGEFLEVERRFGVEVVFSGGGDALDVNLGDHHWNHGRRLFANGRVLPPPQSADVDEGTASSLCRFPVLLAGINGGCIRYIAR